MLSRSLSIRQLSRALRGQGGLCAKVQQRSQSCLLVLKLPVVPGEEVEFGVEIDERNGKRKAMHVTGPQVNANSEGSRGLPLVVRSK